MRIALPKFTLTRVSATARALLVSLAALGTVAMATPQAGNPLAAGHHAGFVTMPPVPPVTVVAGRAGRVSIRFRVNRGYHINSNHPNSELLIPTVISFTAAKPVTLGAVDYPAGEDYLLDFSKEKLKVYTGEVAFSAPVKVPANAAPGSYNVKGELRYQACTQNACYPPKTVPVEFVVNIIKSALAVKSNSKLAQ